jgi:hypothetical protein
VGAHAVGATSMQVEAVIAAAEDPAALGTLSPLVSPLHRRRDASRQSLVLRIRCEDAAPQQFTFVGKFVVGHGDPLPQPLHLRPQCRDGRVSLGEGGGRLARELGRRMGAHRLRLDGGLLPSLGLGVPAGLMDAGRIAAPVGPVEKPALSDHPSLRCVTHVRPPSLWPRRAPGGRGG